MNPQLSYISGKSGGAAGIGIGIRETKRDLAQAPHRFLEM